MLEDLLEGSNIRDIFFETDMSFEAALKVFGLTRDDLVEKDKLKKRYRELSLKHHPDRGGDTGMMMTVNNAHDVLKRTKSLSKRSDFEAMAAEYRRLGKQIKDLLVKTFKPEAFVKYFSDLSGKEFKYKIISTYPKDLKIGSPSHAGFTSQFFTEGKDIVFEFDVHANLIDIKYSKGLGVGDISFNLIVSAYGFFANRKQKLSSRDWKFTPDHATLKDPSKTFPKAKIKKIFSGVTSKRSFKRRDMITFLTRKLGASWDGDTYSRIPLENDLYLVIYRHVVMKQATWGVNGIYKRNKRISGVIVTTMVETEETAKFLADLQKELSKEKNTDRLIKKATKMIKDYYEAWKAKIRSK